ncbi:MAG: monovalent cation/H+ antiporter subunit A [Casimicrobiaceae bacterium]|nr:monovalent cation/H+ antiporter subunit A [Casimicrobiaceae bacterium]MDW8311829.1 monovalent cation/H+ antiporter subunit A [Burkholderiales bacterium]
MLPLLAALLPFLTAVIVAALPTQRRAAAVALGIATAVAGLVLTLGFAPAVFSGEILRAGLDWLPALGLALAVRIDALAWLFMFLIYAIGLLIVLYAAYYLGPEDPAPRFFAFLLAFMGAMLGVVMSANLIVLVVFWELTSLSSFLLIGYWHHRGDAREGARLALTLTGAGGLALLGGVVILGSIVGSYELDRVLASGPIIRAHPLYVPALALVLLGVFTKSAQFPFHFWLPQAMAAPTPVSAYLHSATMVKAGVFLLARLWPALGGSPEWFWAVSIVGLATLLVGAYFAIFQHDLKGLLAYSTVSHLGLITLLFGLNTPMAVVAGVFHIINHATFKAGLFMAAGIIDHEAHTRDIRKLGGLYRLMPITGTLAIIATAAMAGVPLANGFLSKEMFFAEAAATLSTHAWLPLGATVAGVLSVAYSARFIYEVWFSGAPRGLEATPHEPPRLMRVPVEVLTVLCLLVGVFPQAVVGPTLAVAAQAAVFGGPHGALPPFTLSLWHGLNLPLAMSAVALVGGLALYAAMYRGLNLHALNPFPLAGRVLFQHGYRASIDWAERLTARLVNGSLQRYLFLFALTALLAGLLPWLDASGEPAVPIRASRVFDGLNFATLAVFAIAALGTLMTVLAYRSRLVALMALGAVGLAVSLAFLHLSAPDLALTQLMVEVVTLVLFMLALAHLPAESPPERRPGRRLRDALLASAVGLGVAALVFLVQFVPFDSISPYFLETTVPLGGGSNAVNVILVDYRGFDTLGEISVLGIAGIIIFALVASLEGRLPARSIESKPDGRLLLPLALVARLLLPLAVVITFYIFLRGHNEPGGGFIAGLIFALALTLQFIANGQRWVEARMGTDFRPWIAAGLLTAGATGLAAWLFGSPFLTSTYDYPWLPGVGAVPLASAALFDLGVFFVVVGATMVALLAIARLRQASLRLAPPDRGESA